ncbi:hypothetical protein HK101_007252, partial [Irineochytrium annulatum]
MPRDANRRARFWELASDVIQVLALQRHGINPDLNRLANEFSCFIGGLVPPSTVEGGTEERRVSRASRVRSSLSSRSSGGVSASASLHSLSAAAGVVTKRMSGIVDQRRSLRANAAGASEGQLRAEFASRLASLESLTGERNQMKGLLDRRDQETRKLKEQVSVLADKLTNAELRVKELLAAQAVSVASPVVSRATNAEVHIFQNYHEIATLLIDMQQEVPEQKKTLLSKAFKSAREPSSGGGHSRNTSDA